MVDYLFLCWLTLEELTTSVAISSLFYLSFKQDNLMEKWKVEFATILYILIQIVYNFI